MRDCNPQVTSLATSLKVAAATVAVAALHSVLASDAAKGAAERVLGTRRREALYRPLYNVVAVLSFGGLLVRARSLPARTARATTE